MARALNSAAAHTSKSLTEAVVVVYGGSSILCWALTSDMAETGHGEASKSYITLDSSLESVDQAEEMVLKSARQAGFQEDDENDIAMAVDGGVLILQGNGNGTFASADSYDVGHTVGTVAVEVKPRVSRVP